MMLMTLHYPRLRRTCFSFDWQDGTFVFLISLHQRPGLITTGPGGSDEAKPRRPCLKLLGGCCSD